MVIQLVMMIVHCCCIVKWYILVLCVYVQLSYMLYKHASLKLMKTTLTLLRIKQYFIISGDCETNILYFALANYFSLDVKHHDSLNVEPLQTIWTQNCVLGQNAIHMDNQIDKRILQ